MVPFLGTFKISEPFQGRSERTLGSKKSGPFQGRSERMLGSKKSGPCQGCSERMLGSQKSGPFQGCSERMLGSKKSGPFQGPGGVLQGGFTSGSKFTLLGRNKMNLLYQASSSRRGLNTVITGGVITFPIGNSDEYTRPM